jgi:chaperonin GroEL (HSP60 family)
MPLQAGGSRGFNARTEEHADSVTAGIIDPTRAVRVALQDAAMDF